MLFLTGYYGRVYLSTNGLTSQAAHRGYGAVIAWSSIRATPR